MGSTPIFESKNKEYITFLTLSVLSFLRRSRESPYISKETFQTTGFITPEHLPTMRLGSTLEGNIGIFQPKFWNCCSYLQTHLQAGDRSSIPTAIDRTGEVKLLFYLA